MEGNLLCSAHRFRVAAHSVPNRDALRFDVVSVFSHLAYWKENNTERGEAGEGGGRGGARTIWSD